LKQVPPRVLMTDTVGSERRALLEHLCTAGFDAILVRDHAELCLKLLTWPPDVVLTEAAARGKDSLTLARLIRRSARRPVATVFVCSRAPDVDFGDAVLLEPIVFAEVERVLRSVLAGSHRLRDLPV
jgi:DNA-binding response OmpR family regulator